MPELGLRQQLLLLAFAGEAAEGGGDAVGLGQGPVDVGGGDGADLDGSVG